MKIRLGFVSNSSSSSFVVAFPRIPENAKDVQEMVFGDDCCIYYNGNRLSAKDASQQIFAQMAAPATHQQLIDALDGDYYDDSLSWEDSEKEDLRRRRTEEKMEAFIQKNKGVLYAFEFEDKSIGGCILEHGDVFHRLPHLRQSRH